MEPAGVRKTGESWRDQRVLRVLDWISKLDNSRLFTCDLSISCSVICTLQCTAHKHSTKYVYYIYIQLLEILLLCVQAVKNSKVGRLKCADKMLFLSGLIH